MGLARARPDSGDSWPDRHQTWRLERVSATTSAPFCKVGCNCCISICSVASRFAINHLKICDTIREGLGTEECPYASFPELSNAAFVESERVNQEKKEAAAKKPILKSKYIPIMKGLLEVLRKNAGEMTPQAAREALVATGEFEEAALDTGNALGFARNFLADAGYIDRSAEAKKLGMWRLTESGWIVDMTDEEASRVIRAKNARTGDKQSEENALGDADVEVVHYWLYAPGAGAGMWEDFYSQGIMGIGWVELGDLSEYERKADIRTRLQEINDNDSRYFNSVQIVWQFVHDVKPGDVIYAKRGMSEIIGRGVVECDYEYDPDANAEYPNVRKVKWTHKGSWTRDKKFSQKTLTDMTDDTDFVAEVSAYFVDDVAVEVEDEPVVELTAYGKQEFLSEVYMSEEQYDTLVGVLRSKKNIILQGAPGVGKTFAAKRLAYSMMGVKDPERVMMVQFHQSYSYEDFIEGYRPSKDGFELARGAFYTFCRKAAEDDENDYFFIIDEINRGNLSKIFGELFMLIENDKRGSKNKLQLLYSRELFHVPSNVYLIGMMNTADRSLAMLDYALRRRFAFFDLRPGFDSDGFVSYRDGLGNAELNDLLSCVVRLNEDIARDDTLGEGFCIGHSYFCGMKPEDVSDAKLSAIVEYELVPMLREYWFDEPSKVRDWAARLRGALK